MWKWIKRQSVSAWRHARAWTISALIALGIISGALYAETVGFSYVRATLRTDGSALALADIAETKLYCDGVLVTTEAGADQNISANLTIGSHTCHATHVDTAGQESDASNIVLRVVNPARPNPPILDDPPGPP